MEQLLDGVLAPIDLQCFLSWHIAARGQAEASLSSVDHLIEEEAERRLLVHLSQPGLVIVSHVHERIVDAEAFWKTLSLIEALLYRSRLLKEALGLTPPGREMLDLQFLGEEVIVDPRWKTRFRA